MPMDFSWLPQGQDVSALPLGMRVNNPGNIKYNPKLGYAGLLGPSTHTDQGDAQMTFDTPQNGMSAAVRLARTKYNRGQRTPMSIIAGSGGWTPGNTAAAANVARTMGINPNDDLALDNPAQMAKFLRALTAQEHGNASKLYSDEMITQAAGAPAGPTSASTMMAQNVKKRIGVETEGGVMPAAAPAAPSIDRLKQALAGGYDPSRLSMAEDMIASGDAAAPKARNWMDALSSALQTGVGSYEKYKEGGKKKEYAELQRQGLANAADANAIARLLMASPDEATQLKGAEMLAQLEAKKAAGAASFGKSPTIAVGKDGKLVALQFNDKGEAVQVALPEGVQLSEKLMSVDTGTGTKLVGGTSHGTVADVPKDLAGAEAEKKRGELQEVGRQNFPAVNDKMARLQTRLDKLGNSKMREAFTGYSGYLPNVTPEANDYQGLLDEVQGGTFLAGFGDLRGSGAITEIEGLKAEQAISRLKVLAPSDAGYGEALADAKTVFEEIRQNAARRAGMEAAAPRGATTTPAPAAGGFKVLGVR